MGVGRGPGRWSGGGLGGTGPRRSAARRRTIWARSVGSPHRHRGRGRPRSDSTAQNARAGCSGDHFEAAGAGAAEEVSSFGDRDQEYRSAGVLTQRMRHQNGGRYRRDMPRVLGDDFTRPRIGQGILVCHSMSPKTVSRGTRGGELTRAGVLPSELPGRRPTSGGMMAPSRQRAFPAKTSLWGDGPFADQVKRNWS